MSVAPHIVQNRVSWDEDARDDLRAPSLGGVVRWARRLAQARGDVVVAEGRLRVLQNRERDAYIQALHCTVESLAEHIYKNAPSPGEIQDAEKELADAVEAAAFAEQVCRLLELRKGKA